MKTPEDAPTTSPQEKYDLHDPEQYQNVAAYWEACDAAGQAPLDEVRRWIQMQIGQLAV